ncbi:MAG: ABC transporter permease subunit [Phycisphaera sp.]|nr:ABC transporter permease subunit [Phycisphaera sp.]
MSTTEPNHLAIPTRPVRTAKNTVSVRRFFSTWVLHTVLVALSFALVLPFVWLLLTSVKTLEEVGVGSWLPGKGGWRWDNYIEVFRQIPFARYYVNSIFIACWVTFLQVFTSSLAAFAFSRLDWPGRDKVFVLYLSTMMLPGLVMMIPNYQIMISLGWVDRFTGLIVPAAFTAFGTFLLRQFMLSIPKALDEAAEIDGASKWRVYWDVILPMTRPGLITLAIFTFMGNYHSFFWPLVMLKSEFRYTLPIGLLYFDSTAGQETNLLMAAVAMSVIPMVIVFILLQKYLVKGIQLGAVKG